MNGFLLSCLPLSGKLICTLYLMGIGLGCIAAVAQAVTAVGLRPSEIAASFAPDAPMIHAGHARPGEEREIRLEEIPAGAKSRIRTPLLIQTSHTHLFGMTLLAGLLGLIFLFSTVPEPLKAIVISIPFIGTFMDIGGMWLTKFAWPGFSVLIMAGGSLFALGYALIAAFSLRDLWFGKEAIE